MGKSESEEATWRGSTGERSSGGGVEGIEVGRDDCRVKTESNEAVYSGMLGFQSFNTSGRVRGRSSSSGRAPNAPFSAAQDLSPQSCPSPFVACDQSNTSNGLSCFDGCRK